MKTDEIIGEFDSASANIEQKTIEDKLREGSTVLLLGIPKGSKDGFMSLGQPDGSMLALRERM